MSANDTQVGGEHYRTHGDKIQHWDLAVMYDWDPFQYQITKYVMRWKYKHATHAERLKDLQKAAHFLQKYIEEAAHYDGGLNPVQEQPIPANPAHAAVFSDDDWQCEGYYGDGTQLYRCRGCSENVKALTAAAATAVHGACPRGRGYVAQDGPQGAG